MPHSCMVGSPILSKAYGLKTQSVEPKIVISDVERSHIPLPICNFVYKQHTSPSFYSVKQKSRHYLTFTSIYKNGYSSLFIIFWNYYIVCIAVQIRGQ